MAHEPSLGRRRKKGVGVHFLAWYGIVWHHAAAHCSGVCFSCEQEEAFDVAYCCMPFFFLPLCPITTTEDTTSIDHSTNLHQSNFFQSETDPESDFHNSIHTQDLRQNSFHPELPQQCASDTPSIPQRNQYGAEHLLQLDQASAIFTAHVS